jgi:hypothetical protein
MVFFILVSLLWGYLYVLEYKTTELSTAFLHGQQSVKYAAALREGIALAEKGIGTTGLGQVCSCQRKNRY